MKPIALNSEHPTWTRDYWESEAFVGDTNLGYWAWVANELTKDGASEAKIQKQVHESGLPAEVEISVRGGVAEIEKSRGNVTVKIVDYDNIDADRVLAEEQTKEESTKSVSAKKVLDFLAETPPTL